LGLLSIALFLPVEWYYRIPIFVAVIVLNTLRMRHEKKVKAKDGPTTRCYNTAKLERRLETKAVSR
jgi:hypothetical protein